MTAPIPPVGDAGPPARPTLAERFRASPAVWCFAVLNVGAFLFVEARGGSNDVEVMVHSGALVVPMVPGEPWRLLTSTFLHFGAFHLLSNMFGLAIFGPSFERLVGSRRFVALWLTAGLAGSAATILSASGLTIAAGASGSVFGLLGALLFLGLRTRRTEAGAVLLRQASVLLGINLAYGLVTPQIGMAAHLGGAAAGIVVLWLYAVPRPRTDRPPTPTNPNRGLLAAVGLGILVVAASLSFGATLAS